MDKQIKIWTTTVCRSKDKGGSAKENTIDRSPKSPKQNVESIGKQENH
jgi:hypothetical protein